MPSRQKWDEDKGEWPRIFITKSLLKQESLGSVWGLSGISNMANFYSFQSATVR